MYIYIDGVQKGSVSRRRSCRRVRGAMLRPNSPLTNQVLAVTRRNQTHEIRTWDGYPPGGTCLYLTARLM
jgi:hypothetical protein